MSKETTKFNSSMFTILFVIFLILKLTGEIDWSWWWVTSPLWLPIAAALVIIAIALVVYNIKNRN
jgi:Ca2+/H+ antiporter